MKSQGLISNLTIFELLGPLHRVVTKV